MDIVYGIFTTIVYNIQLGYLQRGKKKQGNYLINQEDCKFLYFM